MVALRRIGIGRVIGYASLALGAVSVAAISAIAGIDSLAIAVGAGCALFLGSYMVGYQRAQINARSTDLLRLTKEVRRLKSRRRAIARAHRDSEAVNRRTAAYLSTMSRELRSPVSHMLGLVEAISHGELTESQREHLATVGVTGRSMLTIIDDILEDSPIEASTLKIEERPFAIEDCCRSVIQTMAATAREKHTLITCAFDPELPEWVSGDEARIQQVLISLIDNAIKATEAGAISLTVEKIGTCQARFSIRDTGSGLSEDIQAALTRQVRGAGKGDDDDLIGFGLMLCVEIVTAMGGSMAFNSVPGRGSTFRFTIPLKATTRNAAQDAGNLFSLPETSPGLRTAAG